MSRRKAASKRAILPDPKWGSELLAKFTNIVMYDGKKGVAERIVYDALNIVMERKRDMLIEDNQPDQDNKLGQEVQGADAKECGTGKCRAIELFKRALDLIRPTVEVRSCRVGGSTFQVPVEVSKQRGEALAMRMLLEAARQRSEHGMVARLAGEMIDVFEGRGGALKKREDIHRMAKANQAFAHYRW